MDISSHKASTLPATVSKLYADWGTTNLRAYALDEQGSVVTQRESAMGVRGLAQEDFPDTFDRVFGAWRSVEALPTLLSGMIGSRMGWIEAPYVPCPATMDDIVESLALVPDRGREATSDRIQAQAGLSALRRALRRWQQPTPSDAVVENEEPRKGPLGPTCQID